MAPLNGALARGAGTPICCHGARRFLKRAGHTVFFQIHRLKAVYEESGIRLPGQGSQWGEG
jgi:hypothetical protein